MKLPLLIISKADFLNPQNFSCSPFDKTGRAIHTAPGNSTEISAPHKTVRERPEFFLDRNRQMAYIRITFIIQGLLNNRRHNLSGIFRENADDEKDLPRQLF
jgi:hypothetical protein